MSALTILLPAVGNAPAVGPLLGAGLGGSDFPRPALIYAANPEGPAGDEPSQRPFETIVPLAARLEPTPWAVANWRLNSVSSDIPSSSWPVQLTGGHSHSF